MQTPSFSRTWSLAWPLILGNASIPLLSLVDTAIAGRIPGAADLAGVALGASWITLIFWAFSFLRQATGGLTAQAVGRDNPIEVMGYLQKGLLVAAGAGTLVIGLGQGLVTPLLSLLDVEPKLQGILHDYLVIRLFGAPFVFALYVVYGWWMGQGRTGSAVTLLMGMNLLNIVFSTWLGWGLGWGAKGIAYGTLMAEVTTAVLVLAALALRQGELWRRWNLSGIGQLLQANGWVMLRTLSLLAVFTWFNTQSAQLGTETAAINAVLLTLLAVAAYALDGFADAAEIQVGHSLGSGRPDWVRLALKYTAACSLISASLASLLLWLFAKDWVAWLVPQPDLIQGVLPWLIYLIPLPLIAWISYWMDGVYIGLNAFKAMAGVMVLSTGLVYFPLNLGLAEHGMQAQWWSFWAWQIARACAMLIVFRVWLMPRIR